MFFNIFIANITASQTPNVHKSVYLSPMKKKQKTEPDEEGQYFFRYNSPRLIKFQSQSPNSTQKIQDSLTERKKVSKDFGDTHNIFGKIRPDEHFDLINSSEKKYEYCKFIVKAYEREIQRIKENRTNTVNNPEQLVSEYLEMNYQVLNSSLILTTQAIQNKFNRTALETLAQETVQEHIKSRNICIFALLIIMLVLIIRSNYVMAKIIQSLRNPIMAIQLFKSVKRNSDSLEYLGEKMKSYRKLGDCFIQIRPSLSLLYFTKFLMCAWKLNNTSAEIEAYEKLGKLYYYKGELSQARIFHSKAFNGLTEDENSAIRKLAIAKLMTGSIGKAKKFQDIVGEDEFIVSSDEEIFPIHFKSPEKSNMIKLSGIKKVIHSDVIKTANNNIRRKQFVFKSKIMDGNTVDLKKLKGISQAKHGLGECKDRVFLQHLSPNRNLAIFQSLELNGNISCSKNSKMLVPYIEKADMKKVTKILMKYGHQLKFLLQWIDNFQQQSKNNQKKRLGLLVN